MKRMLVMRRRRRRKGEREKEEACKHCSLLTPSCRGWARVRERGRCEIRCVFVACSRGDSKATKTLSEICRFQERRTMEQMVNLFFYFRWCIKSEVGQVLDGRLRPASTMRVDST